MRRPAEHYSVPNFAPSKINVLNRMSGVVRGIRRARRRIKKHTPSSYKQYKWWVDILRRWKSERDYLLGLIRGN